MIPGTVGERPVADADSPRSGRRWEPRIVAIVAGCWLAGAAALLALLLLATR